MFAGCSTPETLAAPRLARTAEMLKQLGINDPYESQALSHLDARIWCLSRHGSRNPQRTLGHLRTHHPTNDRPQAHRYRVEKRTMGPKPCSLPKADAITRRRTPHSDRIDPRLGSGGPPTTRKRDIEALAALATSETI